MRISHYSTIVVVTIFYLKPMDIASIKTPGKYYYKKHWRLLFKSPKEDIIYKIIHGKNYEKLFKLLFKAHEINTQNLS